MFSFVESRQTKNLWSKQKGETGVKKKAAKKCQVSLKKLGSLNPSTKLACEFMREIWSIGKTVSLCKLFLSLYYFEKIQKINKDFYFKSELSFIFFIFLLFLFFSKFSSLIFASFCSSWGWFSFMWLKITCVDDDRNEQTVHLWNKIEWMSNSSSDRSEREQCWQSKRCSCAMWAAISSSDSNFLSQWRQRHGLDILIIFVRFTQGFGATTTEFELLNPQQFNLNAHLINIY